MGCRESAPGRHLKEGATLAKGPQRVGTSVQLVLLQCRRCSTRAATLHSWLVWGLQHAHMVPCWPPHTCVHVVNVALRCLKRPACCQHHVAVLEAKLSGPILLLKLVLHKAAVNRCLKLFLLLLPALLPHGDLHCWHLGSCCYSPRASQALPLGASSKQPETMAWHGHPLQGQTMAAGANVATLCQPGPDTVCWFCPL